jgi:hypothetical protein
MSTAFELLLIPFLLTAVQADGQILKLQEAEKRDLLADYEDFKLKIKVLMRTTATFITTNLTTTIPYTLRDDGFDDYISRHVSSALTLYQGVLKVVAEEEAAIYTLIQSAYNAYIMFARLLNTGIHLYNDHNPSHQLRQIEGLPDSQCYDITEQTTTGFFERFMQEVHDLLE